MSAVRRRTLGAMRRWWWVLILAPLVAGLGARLGEARYGGNGSPRYSAAAILLLGAAPETGRSSYSVSTYSQLLLTTAVLQPVVTALALTIDVDTMKDRVRAEPIVGPHGQPTELLRVHVADADPRRAAAIANAIAGSFVAYVADEAERSATPPGTAADAQIEATQQRIADAQRQLHILEQGPDSADPSNQQRMEALRSDLRQLQQELADQVQAAQTTDLGSTALHRLVSVVEAATPPAQPDQSPGIDPVAPAALAGLLLAVVAIAVVAQLDTTIRTAGEVAALTGAPLLGSVPRVARLRLGHAQLLTVARPRSTAAEAIRQLRTSLEFAASDRVPMTIVVTSPGPQEGKSTIAASLAAAIAQTSRSVMVVDADLRRPSLHRVFGVRNDRGLSTLLGRPEQPWWSAAVPTTVPQLSLIPSGPIPPNPADLLSLDRVPRLLAEIGDAVDYVVVDTPPLLAVSDTLDVAAGADGVVLVCRANRTKRAALEAAVVRLRQGNRRLFGTALSHHPRRESTYGYGYPPTTHSDSQTDGNVTPPASPEARGEDGGDGPLRVDGGDQARLTRVVGPSAGRATLLPTGE